MYTKHTTVPIEYSVVMPAYQEGMHLENNVGETIEVMEKFDCPYEILVVDDHSTDNTAVVLEKLHMQWPQVHPIFLYENEGKGNALRAGFKQAQGKWVFFLDADLDLHPRQFVSFISKQKETAADVVIGSKRHPDSVLQYPWHRRLMSTVYFFLVKSMFGLPVKDTQTGLKLFKREVLAQTFPKILVKKYAFDLELLVLVHHYHYRIAEAPVVVDYKTKFGYIRPKDVFRIFWDTLAVFYRLYFRRYYDRHDS